jgi:L-histidine N-alpha-methyltransferase
MTATYEVLEAPAGRTVAGGFAGDVLTGLSRPRKSLPSIYFYDETGSRLFQQISELEEYYLTRSERQILETYAGELATQFAGGPFRLVELGAGDGGKTKILLRGFLRAGLQFEYLPVDICEEALVELTGSLHRQIPDREMRVHGIVAEYFDALSLLGRRPAERTVVLFLGSNIGNFEPRQARRFLRSVRRALSPGDRLLIGFDLKKDPEVLTRAYNDARGVTREFNFNLLARINRELGGEFDRKQFCHHGAYNVRLGRMESWLVSLQDQQVAIAELGRVFHFRRGEGIHVECSYKYDLPQIERLAAASGFEVRRQFFDRRQWFVDSLWHVRHGRIDKGSV